MLNCSSTSSAGGYQQSPRTNSGCKDMSTPGTSFCSTNFNAKTFRSYKKRGAIFKRNAYFRKQFRMKAVFSDSSPECVASNSTDDHLIFQNDRGKSDGIMLNVTPVCGTKRKLDSLPFERKMPKYSSPVQLAPNVYHVEGSFSHISDAMWDLYSDKKQTEATLEKKIGLKNKLEEILSSLFPGCKLFIVGSSINGLGADDCDVDMCLILNSMVLKGLKDFTILKHIRDVLMKFRFLKNINLIFAKVPILRMQDKISGCEVDLNINNEVGIRNSQLLKDYAKIDVRVPPLVLIVKLWARFHDINDAKHNSLSSYSLVLMVIHYLQYRCQPPVVPCLQAIQPHKFQDYAHVSQQDDLPKFFSRNNCSVGELFLGFLKYYANEFNFNNVISVRLATVISKSIAMNYDSPKNKQGHWKWLCIEEPFDRTNTACSVCDQAVFIYVKDVFSRCWERLNSIRQLSAVLEF